MIIIVQIFVSSNGKTFWLFQTPACSAHWFSTWSEDCHDLYAVQSWMELLTGAYFFTLLGNAFSHICCMDLFTSFLPFFVFTIFSNLRGSNPTAISKMSIIVSLKKLQSEHGMTHIMEELIIHCNKSIKFYDKPLSGELNIILSGSHTDYKAYICNGNLNLLHRLQFLSVCMSLDLIN